MGRLIIVALIMLPVVSGCDDAQRLNRLEQQTKELQAQLQAQANNDKVVARNYDLQARCSKDARVWFSQNYSRDKDTMMLDFSNHYNAASNQCLIFVEYHFSQGIGASWANSMTLWNVYENSKYGDYLERHTIIIGTPTADKDKVDACVVYGSTCTTADQFNELVRPYMNN